MPYETSSTAADPHAWPIAPRRPALVLGVLPGSRVPTSQAAADCATDRRDYLH